MAGLARKKKICSSAADSFGVGFAKNAFAFQIKQLVEQLMFLEAQIEELDEQISHLLHQVNQVIATIPGIGYTLGAILIMPNQGRMYGIGSHLLSVNSLPLRI